MKHVQTIAIAPRDPSQFSDVLGAEVGAPSAARCARASLPCAAAQSGM